MRRLLRRFSRNDDGNATVEFVLWLPLIMGILVGAFDLNVIMATQSNMWDVARDTARRVSTGELNSTTAQTYALAKLTYMGFDYGVDVTVGDDVVVAVDTYLSNVAVLGSMGGLNSYHVTAAVTMRVETE